MIWGRTTTIPAPERARPSASGRALEALGRWLPLRAAAGDPYAEPWRRLAAAAIDTSLVLAAAAALLTVVNLRSANPLTFLERLPPWMAAAAWSYTLAGWSRGATPGMRACGIRIVAAGSEGGGAAAAAPPGLRRALARVAGYWVACLPVKGGLLPILTDPRRQGWHDRWAGTVVVRAAPRAAPAPPPPASPHIPAKAGRAAPPPPDIAYALRRSGWALAGFAALTLVMTYPVAWQWRGRIAGLSGDSGLFVWSNWWLQYALAHHRSLATTDMLYFPLRLPLYYSTVDWLDAAVAAPLLPRLGMVGTYNALWLGSLTACQYAAYLLIAAVSRRRGLAFAAAPIYGLSPFFMAHGLGHANLISAEFLPLFTLLAYSALTRPRWPAALGAGVALGLGGLCDLQYLLLGVVVAAGLAAGYWGAVGQIDPARLARQALCAALMGAGALLVVGWLLVPALGMQRTATYMNRAMSYDATLASYVDPTPLQNRPWGQPAELPAVLDVETMLAPGSAALLLGVVGALRRGRTGRAWWGAALLAACLSLGPHLTTGGQKAPAGILLLTGFPGNGFALPWRFEGLCGDAQLVVGGAYDPLAGETLIWLPMAWLPTLLPFFHAFRAPARIALAALLPLSVLAALGLRAVSGAISRGRGRGRGRGISALVAAGFLAVLLAQYRSTPYPTYALQVSPLLRLAAVDPGERPVINIPLGPDPQFQIEQTVTGQPMFAGFLSRTPRAAYAEIQANPFLQYCLAQGNVTLPVRPSARPYTVADDRRALAALAALGARWIVVHDAMTDAPRVDAFLRGPMRARRVAGDGLVTLYLVPGSGWEGRPAPRGNTGFRAALGGAGIPRAAPGYKKRAIAPPPAPLGGLRHASGEQRHEMGTGPL